MSDEQFLAVRLGLALFVTLVGIRSCRRFLKIRREWSVYPGTLDWNLNTWSGLGIRVFATAILILTLLSVDAGHGYLLDSLDDL